MTTAWFASAQARTGGEVWYFNILITKTYNLDDEVTARESIEEFLFLWRTLQKMRAVQVFLYQLDYPKHAQHADDLYYIMGVQNHPMVWAEYTSNRLTLSLSRALSVLWPVRDRAKLREADDYRWFFLLIFKYFFRRTKTRNGSVASIQFTLRTSSKECL